MSEKWRCRLFWGNPTTSPPGGVPRIAMAVLCDKPNPVPAEIHAAWSDRGPGSGWCVGWERIDQRPIRRWSKEAKAKVRKRNLRQRMEKQFPLFAEVFIEAELAARPAYYEAAQ